MKMLVIFAALVGSTSAFASRTIDQSKCGAFNLYQISTEIYRVELDGVSSELKRRSTSIRPEFRSIEGRFVLNVDQSEAVLLDTLTGESVRCR